MGWEYLTRVVPIAELAEFLSAAGSDRWELCFAAQSAMQPKLIGPAQAPVAALLVIFKRPLRGSDNA